MPLTSSHYKAKDKFGLLSCQKVKNDHDKRDHLKERVLAAATKDEDIRKNRAYKPKCLCYLTKSFSKFHYSCESSMFAIVVRKKYPEFHSMPCGTVWCPDNYNHGTDSTPYSYSCYLCRTKTVIYYLQRSNYFPSKQKIQVLTLVEGPFSPPLQENEISPTPLAENACHRSHIDV